MQHPMLQDGAYATWQKMLERKVVPNVVTQRVLALAFGGNPLMASALVAEAQKLQARSQPSLPLMVSFALDWQPHELVMRVFSLHLCVETCASSAAPSTPRNSESRT